jgi:hypothetical protein
VLPNRRRRDEPVLKLLLDFFGSLLIFNIDDYIQKDNFCIWGKHAFIPHLFFILLSLPFDSCILLVLADSYMQTISCNWFYLASVGCVYTTWLLDLSSIALDLHIWHHVSMILVFDSLIHVYHLKLPDPYLLLADFAHHVNKKPGIVALCIRCTCISLVSSM